MHKNGYTMPRASESVGTTVSMAYALCDWRVHLFVVHRIVEQTTRPKHRELRLRSRISWPLVRAQEISAIVGHLHLRSNMQIYTIDDSAATLTTRSTVTDGELGERSGRFGCFTKTTRGLLDVGILRPIPTTLTPCLRRNEHVPPITVAGPLNWLQAGGFVQLKDEPVTPLAAATACPSSNRPQTYQFVSIPAPLSIQSGQ